RDDLRADASDVVAQFKRAGLTPIMLSGDRLDVASAVADEAGIENWRAEMKPQEKISFVNALKRTGARVLMVGDGLNDAPALAAADASISPATGSDLSQTTADFVFQGDRLAPVAEAFNVAR